MKVIKIRIRQSFNGSFFISMTLRAITLCLCLSPLHVFAQNLLSARYKESDFNQKLIPYGQWHPFPSIDDREGWMKANQEMLKAYLDTAQNYLHYQWPSIPATSTLLIARTGDRQQYESISFKKRRVLGTLLLAEIYENKGRFLDDIVNGVWSICEESFWGASAHIPKSDQFKGLPDVSDPFVELFGAETADYLGWVDYFLGPRLDSISPQIRKRIYYEVNKRIFEPAMTKDHGWMHASDDGTPPNNWNPWICSNWITAALLLEPDNQKRSAMVYKALNVLDQFLNPYPADGGCDEGPSYWGAAAASLYDNLSILNTASNNAFTYAYQDEKIKNMARFIFRAQISPRYFLDFADADPQPDIDGTMIYRFGKAINDSDMMKFGAYYLLPPDGEIELFHYFRNLFALFVHDEIEAAPKGLPLPHQVWLPDLQVMLVRDHNGSTDGFFLAAKGGTNGESHNHNDVGNFIVYFNGLPLLMDVGRGTYTSRTFSSHRYDIWFNQSDYHNVPQIAGIAQHDGRQFAAKDVSFDSKKSTLHLSIANAYPTNAHVSSWERAVGLDHGRDVHLDDDFTLTQPGVVAEHFMTCYPSEAGKKGEWIIHYAPEGAPAQDFVIRYDAKQFKASAEKVKLGSMEDEGIIEKWGDSIYRITLESISPVGEGSYHLTIRQK